MYANGETLFLLNLFFYVHLEYQFYRENYVSFYVYAKRAPNFVPCLFKNSMKKSSRKIIPHQAYHTSSISQLICTRPRPTFFLSLSLPFFYMMVSIPNFICGRNLHKDLKVDYFPISQRAHNNNILNIRAHTYVKIHFKNT